MSVPSAMRGVPVTLQDAAVSGDGIVIAIPDGLKLHTFYIKGSAGVSAGAVQPESASSHDYAGTWGQIGGGPITVDADTELIVNFEGIYKFIRVGISTPIADGTVTVKYVGS